MCRKGTLGGLTSTGLWHKGNKVCDPDTMRVIATARPTNYILYLSESLTVGEVAFYDLNRRLRGRLAKIAGNTIRSSSHRGK